MTATKLTTQDLQTAAYRAWVNLDRCNTLDAGVKREMCEILGCAPWELDAALTDEAVSEIFFPSA